MPIDTFDKYVAALADQSASRYAQRRHCFESSMTARAFGFLQSMWKSSGNPGVGVSPPASPGAIPTRATAGALNLLNPAAGDEMRLARFGGDVSNGGSTLYLCERLFHMSGLNGTLTTVQNVDPTPTNPVNRGPGAGGEPGQLGEDVEAFIEVYTALGATGPTITTNYVDETGTARTAAGVSPFGALNVAGQMARIAPTIGRGVRSVSSVQLSVSTGTIGDFGVTLLRRIAAIGTGQAGWSERDAFRLGFPWIPTDACLFFMVDAASAVTGDVMADVDTVRGLA